MCKDNIVSTEFIIGTISAAIALITFWFGFRHERRIAKVNLFTQYTNLCHKIMLKLVEYEPHNDSRNYESLDKKQKFYVQSYIDLCSEEWHVRENENIIDNKVWKSWVEGMQMSFENQLFREAWKCITKEKVGYYDEEFIDFVNDTLINKIPEKSRFRKFINKFKKSQS